MAANTPSDLIGDGKPIAKNYRPVHTGYGVGFANKRIPRFTVNWVPEMMRDGRVTYGLGLIKGPIIANGRWDIETPDSNVMEYVDEMMDRLWLSHVMKVLTMIEYGWSPCEVVWHWNNERQWVTVKDLIDFQPLDCRPITRNGERVGMSVQSQQGNPGDRTENKYWIPTHRSMWAVHQQQYSKWFGRSQLWGAFPAYLDIWGEHGFRDCRRLHYQKNAENSGILYVPIGQTPQTTTTNGSADMIDNMALGHDIMEKMKTGGYLIIPNEVDPVTGAKKWEYQPPSTTGESPGQQEYGIDLKNEILEGMNVPPEVAAASETGAYAGKSIPMQAFACMEQMVFNGVLEAFEAVCKVGVRCNFGLSAEQNFRLVPKSLFDTMNPEGPGQQEDAGMGTLGGMEDDGQGGGDPLQIADEEREEDDQWQNKKPASRTNKQPAMAGR